MFNMEKQPENKKDTYLLGGADLEMYQIEKRLKRAGAEYVNRNLQWGAKIDDYNDVVEEILTAGGTPVAVELGGASAVEGVVDIDHHNDKFHMPASITQVNNRLGRKIGLVDEMIGANDSGYIPGMERVMEAHRAELEERYGPEKFEILKKKLVDLIRSKDREMQGITKEMEQDAEDAIAHAEHGPRGLVITRITGSKPSPITDRLFSSWIDGKENLIVVCLKDEPIKDVYYFGRGDICREVKEKFSGWGGGVGYGNAEKVGFSGGKLANPEDLIRLVKEKNL